MALSERSTMLIRFCEVTENSVKYRGILGNQQIQHLSGLVVAVESGAHIGGVQVDSGEQPHFLSPDQIPQLCTAVLLPEEQQAAVLQLHGSEVKDAAPGQLPDAACCHLSLVDVVARSHPGLAAVVKPLVTVVLYHWCGRIVHEAAVPGVGGGEVRYSTVEKEALALVMAVRTFAVYFGSAPVVVFTDHSPLTFINSMANSNDKLLRWSLELQKYALDIRHRPGRDNLLPDLLSRPSLVTNK